MYIRCKKTELENRILTTRQRLPSSQQATLSLCHVSQSAICVRNGLRFT